MRNSPITNFLFAVVILLAVAVGAALWAAPLQVVSAETYDPNTVPFPYDKSQVVGEILGTVTNRAGVTGQILGTYSDPDTDPVTVRLTKAPAEMLLKQDPNSSSYVLTWTPTAAGVYYVAITAKDQPPAGDSLEATGTILWDVLPKNRSPFLGPVGNLTVAR
jgi:hypothetical protein